MFIGSLLIAIVLIGFGSYLQWNESFGWHEDNDEDSANLLEHEQEEVDRNYFSARRRSRKRVQMLMIACGILIVIAALMGKGVFWLGAWMTVTLALAVIVMLAGLDGARTVRYQKAKRQSMNADFKKS